MKKYFITFSILLFLTHHVNSQQKTMVLRVNEVKENKIVLQFGGTPLTGGDLSFTPDSAGWEFKVISGHPITVTVRNLVLNDDALVITDFSKSYPVKNDIMAGKLKLSNSFKISVSDAAGKEIRSFDLKKKSTASEIVKDDLLTPMGTNYIVGSMVHDALYLQKGSKMAIKAKILQHYALRTIGADMLVPKDSLKNAYLNNPFMNDMVTDFVGAQSLLGLGTLFSGAGGMPVTRIADGLSQFLVERAKQELSIAFFRKFKKTLQDPRYRDLPTLFPMTADLLLQLEEEIENYERLIDNLREAFKNDIQRIHYNFPGIIDNHPAFFESHRPLKAGLLSACYIAQEADNQTHPGDIIANYPLEFVDELDDKNYKGTIQTIQLLSYSFRDTLKGEEASYWVPISSLRELVNDRKALKIYLGLIYQVARLDYDSIPYDRTTLVHLLDEVAKVYDHGSDVYQRYKVFILKYGEKVDAVTKMIRETKVAGMADSVKVETYIRFVKTTVDLLAYSAEICKLPVIKPIGTLAEFPAKSKKYFDLAYAAVDLSAAINRKNYPAAINGAVSLYAMATTKNADIVLHNAGNDSAAGITVAVSQVSGTNTDSLSSAVDTLQKVAGNRQDLKLSADSIKQFAGTRGKLLKYGSFMASVANATSAKQVKDIIEKAALPVGSSRIKRAAQFNVAINGYIGGYFGFEKIQKVESKSTLNTFGITAPVGVSVSMGKQLLFWPTKDEWSTSLFVSLIDVGTIAAFRIKDDSTEQIPAIQLKHIFAPGAFVSVGIPKTPLSLNIGWQVGPNLRKIVTTPTLQNDYSQYMYTRFAVSLVVDIPVFNLYTSD
jgi:hypothetical protein